VLATLIEHANSQTLHFYLDKTEEITNIAKIVTLQGGTTGTATYQVLANEVSNNNEWGLPASIYKARLQQRQLNCNIDFQYILP
jgi:hypothetical protein